MKLPIILVVLVGLKVFATTESIQPNNSGVNVRDRSVTEVTAQDQGNSTRDIELTQRIRREVTQRPSFSVDAQNIKIISQNGMVTLKGPVRSASEKREIELIATSVAGAAKVVNQIEIVSQ